MLSSRKLFVCIELRRVVSVWVGRVIICCCQEGSCLFIASNYVSRIGAGQVSVVKLFYFGWRENVVRLVYLSRDLGVRYLVGVWMELFHRERM